MPPIPEMPLFGAFLLSPQVAEEMCARTKICYETQSVVERFVLAEPGLYFGRRHTKLVNSNTC